MKRLLIALVLLCITSVCGATYYFPAYVQQVIALVTIASKDAAYLATPYLSGSTVIYVSDCQTGNAIQPSVGCVQGSDTLYDGTSPTINGAHGPYQTLEKAVNIVAATTSGTYTIALAQGGVWNANPVNFAENFNSYITCPQGLTCTEIREYPQGGTGQRPTVYYLPTTGTANNLFYMGNGIRLMNFSLISNVDANSALGQTAVFFFMKGEVAIVGSGAGSYTMYYASAPTTWTAVSSANSYQGIYATTGALPAGTTGQTALVGSGLYSIYVYTGSAWTAFGPNVHLLGTYATTGTLPSAAGYLPYSHDVSVLNMNITSFVSGINESLPADVNTTIIGNHFTNISQFGYNGGSNNLNIGYNYLHNVGSSILQNHAIYVASHYGVSGVTIQGNYMEGYWTNGATYTQCVDALLVLHAAIDQLTIDSNLINNASNAAAGCSGISANNNTAAAFGSYLTNTTISNNVVINGGNSQLNVTSCPGCQIINNLLISDNALGGWGIVAPENAARTNIANCIANTYVPPYSQCSDAAMTGYTIANNTSVFTANATNGTNAGLDAGIVSTETQTGIIVENNTVEYLANSAGLNQVHCFKYPLSYSAYTRIDHNNCYVPSIAYVWEAVTGDSLATWQAASGFDTWDSANSNANALGNPSWTIPVSPYLTQSDSSVTYQYLQSNFTPAASGVLAGKGIGANAPTKDITGATRPNPPAIGAYE